VGPDGRFETLLDRGTYRAAIARPGTVERHEWSLAVGDDDLALDVGLPGVRVAGVIETGARPRSSWMLVRLQAPREAHFWDHYVAKDLAFHFDGVPPGRYRLWGMASDKTLLFEEPLELVVPADRDVTGLTIRLR